ncbi:MAG: acyltransferase [Pseudomonadales bacterium]|uniref:Putative maltose O-acetyltransferase n=1 Tax=Oleiphilus messinensis TaxID=141451 RepID=A0A1Y0I6S1_9GAMM|nr:acyltransferase [Oleiphilus messinensis]ARU55225.1 putative maltose O-acetyltransferase [Oleiphilus messinensis]MCG8611149.1 acyltransferase [Pseudomonadales bacterium]
MSVVSGSLLWRKWIKESDNAIAGSIRKIYRGLVQIQCPLIRVVHHPLYVVHLALSALIRQWCNFWYWTPLFKSRLNSAPKVLHLYSGMPQVMGALELHIDEGARISGHSSFFGRSVSGRIPTLTIGRNVDVGWQTTIAVGTRVQLDNDVRIAGKCYLAGFPGHPINPEPRRLGLPETDDQVGDIVLEENVWLATGVTVLPGVRIGRNSIIGTNSVVTRNIPANVIAAGSPARVIRQI